MTKTTQTRPDSFALPVANFKLHDLVVALPASANEKLVGQITQVAGSGSAAVYFVEGLDVDGVDAAGWYDEPELARREPLANGETFRVAMTSRYDDYEIARSAKCRTYADAVAKRDELVAVLGDEFGKSVNVGIIAVRKGGAA